LNKKSTLDDITLTSYDDIFGTDSENTKTLMEIAPSNLQPFKNHPFKLYEGQRFSDMVESIKANGILVPIIVRPIDSESYEILSGHNRVEAAKTIGLETIPAIIRGDLTDDEALLVVTETNLIQRSFADLSHSERAAALAIHHEAVKNQGRRTDLITEIENLLKNSENISNDAEVETSGRFVQKLDSRDSTGDKYNLNGRAVARYIRLNSLVEPLKKLVDDDKIPFFAAIELSYISEQNQFNLVDCLNINPKVNIEIKKAKLLREFSESDKFSPAVIENVFSGKITAPKKKNRTSLPVQSLKIKGKILSKYFKPEQKPEEIQAELIEALEFYRAHKG